MTTTRTIFFVMVYHPAENAFVRVGQHYQTKEAAKSWVTLVKKAWHGCATKTVPCVLKYTNGKLTEASKKKLSEKFNVEAA